MRYSNITRSLGTVVLAAALMAGLSACGKTETPTTQPTAAPTTSQTTAPTTQAPSPTPTASQTWSPDQAPITKPSGDVNPGLVWGRYAPNPRGSSNSRLFYPADQMPSGAYAIQPRTYQFEGQDYVQTCVVSAFDKVGVQQRKATYEKKFDSPTVDTAVQIPAGTTVVLTTCELRTSDQNVIAKMAGAPRGTTASPWD